PAHGTLTFNANGSFTYVPAAGYSGPDTFTYRATDGTRTSNDATVTIQVVTKSLPKPIANGDAYTVSEAGSRLSRPPGALGNAGERSGRPLSALVINEPVHGTLVFSSDGSFAYSPDRGFSGTDSFTYRNFNGSSLSDPATVTIQVTAAAH